MVSTGKDRLGKDSIDKSSRGKKSNFKPPTLQEVEEYCKERNNNVNPQRFIDFYTSKGWMVGKNKMKDWKACVRTWEQLDKNNNTSKPYTKKNNFKLSDRSVYDDMLKQEMSKMSNDKTIKDTS